MARAITSRKKALFFSALLFFLSLTVIIPTKILWPGIILSLGISLALRQYLLGRRYDMWISLFVFGGAFITAQFNINWEVFLPALFILGAFYLIIREWLTPDPITEEEIEENIEKEIEESDEMKK